MDLGILRTWRSGMKKTHENFRLILVGIITILFLILDLRVAFYHLTTEGWKSGVAEITLAFLLLFLVYLALMGRERREISPSWKRFHRAALVIILLFAAFVLFLSIYHFTHQGPRSGALELSMSILLLLLGYLLS
jgi:small-conductance mechanosensitive channel